MGDKPFNLSVRNRADGTDISLTAQPLQENLSDRSNHFDVEVLASAVNSQNGAQTMKRFLVALTLTCVLSVSAMAGSIPTCGAPDPPPPTTQSSVTTTVILTIISLVVG